MSLIVRLYRSSPAPVRVLQPPREVRRGDGARDRVLRDRKQGGARAHRADEERPRELRETGRTGRLRAHPRTTDGDHLSQGQGVQVPTSHFEMGGG